MEGRLGQPIDSASQMKKATTSENSCRHHWLLGQPEDGMVGARCRSCGQTRSYPAALDDSDWVLENEVAFSSLGVATAAGGARPSSSALLVDYES